jgi:hypothetical protein
VEDVLKMSEFQIPILIIGYTRPELVAKQIELLRTIKPRKIYFYLDGPRSEKDAILMKKTNEQLDKIDWNVKLTKNINDVSLGAAAAITGAINWVFNFEENIVILEDDVLPCIEFFEMCEKYLGFNLAKNKIGAISGHQVEQDIKDKDLKCHLSLYPRIHGWATQKEVWQNFNYKISISKFSFLKLTLKLSHFNLIFFVYLCYVHVKIRLNKLDTWDYQFLYYLNLNKLFTIVPNYNLVINLGYGKSATHTKLTGIKQEYFGAGLSKKFDPISDLRYLHSADRKWRYYRVKMLLKSLLQIIKNKLRLR